MRKSLHSFLGACGIFSGFAFSTAVHAEESSGNAPSLIQKKSSQGEVSFTYTGKIFSLKSGEKEWINPKENQSGFSILYFDGITVREIPLSQVKISDDDWVLRGQVPFPKFTLHITPTSGGVEVQLKKVEGAPLGRDASLVLKISSSSKLKVTGEGIDVEGEEGQGLYQIFWKWIGETSDRNPLGRAKIEEGR